jgi:hypothetical protein
MQTIRQVKSRRRGGKRLFAALILAVIAAVALAVPALAANPPAFPNNIVIFPERDFVVLEGYEAKAGQNVTVTVSRNGVQTSSARGVVGRGDPSLEINHPGGVCWRGVTPDIKPGDVVTVAFQDGRRDAARTLDVSVTGFSSVGADQLVIDGTLGAGVNPAFVEQRVINPEMDPTAIGRRDVRAPAREGPYTSELAFPTATSLRATYTFQNADDEDGNPWTATEMRDIAAQGQMRVLAWQRETPAGDRQGITIYEFEEVGGPGIPGCADGPENTPPNAPRNVRAFAGNQSVRATWAGASTIPDSPPITGYRVTAVNLATRLQTSVNVDATARAATVPDLTNRQAYRVQVRALSDAGSSRPGLAGPVTPRAPAP